ncbi:MAG TPA: histidine--tRNA ligase [Acidimicrobiia bacterium]|nr:histidine--tRNA ligase [Acidimicrobiia bacterium]
MSFQPPKGTDDIIAPASQAWREALRSWETWSERYGYPLISLPIFESTHLFERGVGDTTEVVTKQMYTFIDQGGRSVTLRPEGTAGAVRAFLNSGHQGVWKGAYSGPFFRYERPQAGRRRQFWQVGVEYLDSSSPVADTEVIELGFRYITSLGLEAVDLLINSIGDPNCRPDYVETLRSYLESKESQLSADSVRLIDRNPLRVLDSKVDEAVLTDAPRMVDHLCDACATHYKAVKEGLAGLEIPYTEDSNLVRGLDYYTRTAFEYIATGLDAAQNAVGGGGRYDGLAEAIGGRPAPGVGFALGLDRIMLALGEPVRAYLDAYLVSETGPEDALRIASRLRREGVRVDFDSEGRSVKAQFRAARRLEVPAVLVWRGDGQLVDVQTENERAELPLQEVSNWFKG